MGRARRPQAAYPARCRCGVGVRAGAADVVRSARARVACCRDCAEPIGPRKQRRWTWLDHGHRCGGPSGRGAREDRVRRTYVVLSWPLWGSPGGDSSCSCSQPFFYNKSCSQLERKYRHIRLEPLVFFSGDAVLCIRSTVLHRQSAFFSFPDRCTASVVLLRIRSTYCRLQIMNSIHIRLLYQLPFSYLVEEIGSTQKQ